ncbi:MAG TPA: TolC family protein [Oculatellaceae cyanobacterium]
MNKSLNYVLVQYFALFSSALSAIAAQGPIFEQPQQNPALSPKPGAVSGSTDSQQSVPTPNLYFLSGGGEPVKLTLSAAFKLADDNNPEIIRAGNDVSLAAAGIKTAAAIPNPQLSVQSGFGQAYTNTIAGEPQAVGINQIFETGGKRRSRIRVAKASQELSAIKLRAVRFDIHSRVRRAYLELSAAQAFTELVMRQRNLAERLLSIARDRFKAGDVPESDTYQAELSKNQFDTQVNLANGRIRQAQIQLSTLLGLPTNSAVVAQEQVLVTISESTDLVPKHGMNLPQLNELVESGFSQRPDILAAKQQINVSTQQLRLAKAQRIPDVIIGSGFVYTTFRNVPQQQFGAFLNVNVDLPIFYQRQGEIAAAQAVINQSTTDVLITQRKTQAEIQAAYENFHLAQANINQYEMNLIENAQRSTKAAELAYKYGKNRLADVILAQQAAQQVNSGYFDAVISYANAWSDLEKAVGHTIAAR